MRVAFYKKHYDGFFVKEFDNMGYNKERKEVVLYNSNGRQKLYINNVLSTDYDEILRQVLHNGYFYADSFGAYEFHEN